jgi:hypothetical protein
MVGLMSILEQMGLLDEFWWMHAMGILTIYRIVVDSRKRYIVKDN